MSTGRCVEGRRTCEWRSQKMLTVSRKRIHEVRSSIALVGGSFGRALGTHARSFSHNAN